MNQIPDPPHGRPPGGPPPGAGQGPYGQNPYGQAPYGQAPYGRSPYGQAPYGQNPYGQTQAGPNSGGSSYASSPDGTPAVVTTARALLGVAAAAAIAYGVFAILVLRGIYSDFDAGDATLGDVDDRLDIHNIAVWVAIVAVAVALAAWVASIVTAGRGAQVIGIGALVMTVLAAVVAGFGLVRMTGAEQGDAAATGALVAGIGFVVVAVGLVMGLLAMRAPSNADASRGPYGAGGYGNQPQHPYGQGQQGRPYGDGPHGHGQHGHGQGQYGQSPPGYSRPPGSYQPPRQQPGQPGQQPYGGPSGR